MQKLLTFFHDQSFNDTLTNDIANFEQLGPPVYRFPKLMPVAVYYTMLCFAVLLLWVTGENHSRVVPYIPK